MNKVKIFYSWYGITRLEEEINDFAIDHKIINVSITVSQDSNYYAVVLYEVL